MTTILSGALNKKAAAEEIESKLRQNRLMRMRRMRMQKIKKFYMKQVQLRAISLKQKMRIATA